MDVSVIPQWLLANPPFLGQGKTHPFTYIYIYVFIYIYLYVCLYMHIWINIMYRCTYIYSYTYLCIYINIHIGIYTCTYIYFHMHIHIRINACIYIHICICKHICVYIYIYIYMFTKRQMSIRTAEVRPFYFFICFGRGTSVARRDHGGGLALSESSRGYCRSWYDAEITRNRQWRQRITEDLPDASKMYDWRNIFMHMQTYIYIYIHANA